MSIWRVVRASPWESKLFLALENLRCIGFVLFLQFCHLFEVIKLWMKYLLCILNYCILNKSNFQRYACISFVCICPRHSTICKNNVWRKNNVFNVVHHWMQTSVHHFPRILEWYKNLSFKYIFRCESAIQPRNVSFEVPLGNTRSQILWFKVEFLSTVQTFWGTSPVISRQKMKE